LYGVLDQGVRDFNVTKYRELALATIKDVHARGKTPVVCGGTNYYIESLLFESAEAAQ
jgi:tRNA dimethylallyltransferase